MIKYRCSNCDVKLETDDRLGGYKEPCPDCGVVNNIPLSKKQIMEDEKLNKEKIEQNKEILNLNEILNLAEKEEHKQPKQPKQPKQDINYSQKEVTLSRSQGGFIVSGILLLIFSVIIIYYCLTMDKTLGDNVVVNIGVINDRLCGTVIGIGLFISGCILSGMGVICSILRENNRNYLIVNNVKGM